MAQGPARIRKRPETIKQEYDRMPRRGPRFEAKNTLPKSHKITMRFSCVELCAGGGGRALGLEIAGFDHLALVESDRHSIRTLRHNRPHWNVIEEDLHTWNPKPYEGVDLVSAGLPFARSPKAGSQLGANDDRSLIPKILEIIRTIRPRGLLIDSVRRPVGVAFRDFREQFLSQITGAWLLCLVATFEPFRLRPSAASSALSLCCAEIRFWETLRVARDDERPKLARCEELENDCKRDCSNPSRRQP